MGAHLPVLALTPGEPAGIGPDLAVLRAATPTDSRLVIIADSALLQTRARLRGIEFSAPVWQRQQEAGIYVLPLALHKAVTPGRLDSANAAYVMACLDRAVAGCMEAEFDALVTGPVQKSIINDAGIAFSGHTEYLAQRAGVARVVMMLTSPRLRVALATTHLSLAEVPRHIQFDSLVATLRIVHTDLQRHFDLKQPRIGVCGLNPHAGESGHLGREEIEVIAPAIRALQAEGLTLIGPLPADTAFTPRQLQALDVVVAMYHDQGLPVLKYDGFGAAVNVTLGLPFIRTSVDHGTALDLAGRGEIDAGSLDAAIAMALRMTRARAAA